MAKTDERKIDDFPPAWLEKYDETELERLSIMTMDGGVPDRLAEKYIERERVKK